MYRHRCTLKMDAALNSEAFVSTGKTTRRHKPEYHNQNSTVLIVQNKEEDDRK